LTREGFVRNHLKPAIGNTKLAKLAANDVRSLYRQKSRQRLATSSVKRIHELLKQALRYAVRSKYIGTNPLDEVKPPKASYREMDRTGKVSIGAHDSWCYWFSDRHLLLYELSVASSISNNTSSKTASK
jgi:hypothetical protein